MKEHIPGSGKKIGCGGFCVVNVYAAIVWSYALMGKLISVSFFGFIWNTIRH